MRDGDDDARNHIRNYARDDDAHSHNYVRALVGDVHIRNRVRGGDAGSRNSVRVHRDDGHNRNCAHACDGMYLPYYEYFSSSNLNCFLLQRYIHILAIELQSLV